MEIKLDEKDRGWATANLEEVRYFVDNTKEWMKNDWFAEGPVRLEFLDHIIAIIGESKCEDCGADFSK